MPTSKVPSGPLSIAHPESKGRNGSLDPEDGSSGRETGSRAKRRPLDESAIKLIWTGSMSRRTASGTTPQTLRAVPTSRLHSDNLTLK